jgi:hypothetical protein
VASPAVASTVVASPAVASVELKPVNFPGWEENQAECMREAESNVLSIDVESNNPSRGPLRVCAFVLMSYRKLLQYEIIDRVQFVVERSENEYEEDGLMFWKEKAITIDRYFDHPSTTRLSPAEAARHIRAYLDHCWETVPSLAILVDEPQTDHALLYEFLKQHGHRPMCYDSKGIYKRNVHVTRDLMRGAFSMIDSRFINLEESDMYLYIHRYWHELVQQYQSQQKQQHHQQHHQQQQHQHQQQLYHPFNQLHPTTTATAVTTATSTATPTTTVAPAAAAAATAMFLGQTTQPTTNYTTPSGYGWHLPQSTTNIGNTTTSVMGVMGAMSAMSGGGGGVGGGVGGGGGAVGCLSLAVCRSAEVVSANQNCIFRTQLGPEMKHVPVFDATQSLVVWAKMEDIKRLFHLQLMKIALTAPSLLLLPKPGPNPNPNPNPSTTNTSTTNASPYYSRPLSYHSLYLSSDQT